MLERFKNSNNTRFEGFSVLPPEFSPWSSKITLKLSSKNVQNFSRCELTELMKSTNKVAVNKVSVRRQISHFNLIQFAILYITSTL